MKLLSPPSNSTVSRGRRPYHQAAEKSGGGKNKVYEVALRLVIHE
jgi:hypothetical protein